LILDGVAPTPIQEAAVRRRALEAIFILTALVAPAAGQEPADSGDKVREHFERGQALYEEGRFEDAAAAFRDAYAIKPASALIYNEAVCYERMNDRPRAAALFRQYLQSAPNARDRAAVQRRIEALAGTATATPEAAPPPAGLQGVFFIESNPSGATLYLDDKNGPPLGQTPWNGTLDGTHTVIVVAPGYKEERKSITPRPNSVNQLYLALSRDQYLGWLEVRANVPEAEVYIDNIEGGAAGRAPFMGNLPPGKHTITVRREGFNDEQRSVDIVAGEALKLDLALSPAPIGFVNVSGSTAAGATVKVDGKAVCVAPCRFRTTAGAHTVSVSRGGQKTYSRRLAIENATETDLQVRLMPKRSKTDVIWKLGVGAALVGGGVFLTMKANDLGDEIAADPTNADNDDKDKRQKLFKYGGWGALGLGGVFVVTGMVALIAERGPRSSGSAATRDLAGVKRPVSVLPAFGPGYAGAMATIRF
jgi:hypothetical protein